jgi:acetoin utilization deacetylase AcuC-like enzyme
LYYTDSHALPLPTGHKFPIAKYRMLRDLLERTGFFQFEPAPLSDLTTIKLSHDPAYVEDFVRGRLSDAAIRRIGFPWSPELVKRTLASVGATLAATDEALKNGWGGTLAGGTHHAFYAEGAGFCIFNDIAVAIRKLQAARRFERFAVIDLDVHQGDGTAQIFQDDPSVLTFSIHCKNNFPLRKQISKFDIALDAGVGDDAYLQILLEALPRVWAFKPQIIFYQAGVDVLKSDALGRLALSPEGLHQRDRVVFELVRKRELPFVITLGGGYSVPIELTARAHANTFLLAREILS